MKKLVSVIIGLGKTGYGCAKFLQSKNIPFAMTDSREQPPYLQMLKNEIPNASLSLGKFDQTLMLQASEIIVSQGVKFNEPTIVETKKKGITIISDLELFARHVNAPTVVITGSNAKSTVTALVGEMTKQANYRALVGGNFGTPAPELLLESPPQSYVLEASNFQLELTYSLQATIGSVLNISPDHLDRYNTYKDYINAKRRVYNGCQIAVVNRHDELTWVDKNDVRQVISFGLDKPYDEHFGIVANGGIDYLAHGKDLLMPVYEIMLQGKQNYLNALAALAIGNAMGLPTMSMCEVLRQFKGLPHRCQKVAEQRGVTWFNDSKGTNVGATIAAIESVKEQTPGKICMIAGGLAKTDDFSLLYAPIKSSVKELILFGQSTAAMYEAFNHLGVAIHCVDDLAAAVSLARELTHRGDTVLFSPACASFDMFRDYSHRGEVFCQLVKEGDYGQN